MYARNWSWRIWHIFLLISILYYTTSLGEIFLDRNGLWYTYERSAECPNLTGYVIFSRFRFFYLAINLVTPTFFYFPLVIIYTLIWSMFLILLAWSRNRIRLASSAMHLEIWYAERLLSTIVYQLGRRLSNLQLKNSSHLHMYYVFMFLHANLFHKKTVSCII